MSQSTGNRSSNTSRRVTGDGVESHAGTAVHTQQNLANSVNGQSSRQSASAAQTDQQRNATQDQAPDGDEMRADRLLRLVLAILRGGSMESASSLVETIRQNSREGSDEVDLRAVAEHALRICRNDPGVQEELEVVEALLQEFREDAIYTRFPL